MKPGTGERILAYAFILPTALLIVGLALYPFVQAALIEPLAVTVRGMRRLRLEDKRNALVLGDGPIGLLSVMLLRHLGVEEIVLAGGRVGRRARRA